MHLAAYNGHEESVCKSAAAGRRLTLTLAILLTLTLTLAVTLIQVVALLRGGGSVVPRDVQGRTPLSVAAFKGHAAVVRLLYPR